MALLLEKEENYIRLSLLLKVVSPRAVRTFFDTEFPPTYLPSILNEKYKTLYDLFLKRRLNQTQWNILFPKNSVGVPDSQTFDVTLMICLIRNLTYVNPPINGFDCLPLPMEKTPGSDLARIKWYRNRLAHPDSKTMSTGDFNTSWANIADAVSPLGGLSMIQECQDLKVKFLDQSNQEIKLEIKLLKEEMQEIRRTMDAEHSTVTENLRDLQDSYSTFQIEHSKVTDFKDPIPWNIRELITEELESWKEDDKTFIETIGAKSVLKSITENDCVSVTASSGTGKTSLVRHVALQMQNEGYDILPVSNPKEIIKWYNPSKKVLFVVDDLCGTYSLNSTQFENWKNLMVKITALVEKKTVKLIVSCRLQVYKDYKMKSLSLFQSCKCNLLSEGVCLSKSEKQSIAESYLQTNASKISEFSDRFDCFPLLCQLCSKNTKLNMVDFFKNPFTVYRSEIDKLKAEGAHDKYCALALCVMFNNCLKEDLLTEDVDVDIKTVIKNTYEACKVLEGTSRLVLRDELDSLTHTFIRKDGDVYRSIHDKLFDFLAFYFGSVMPRCLIKNATSQFISERFVFERKNKSDELTIIVPERYQQMYLNRMVDDWSRGKVVDVFCNINMENCIFRQQFLVHIQGLEISQQKKLASLYDTNNETTPLIQCCFDGDINLVKWCLYRCLSNVNRSGNGDKVSPLYIACQEGHTTVVQLLINNKADINKCEGTGGSPLFAACQRGYSNVAQILINNKADINKCNDENVSPLYIASWEGNTEIVQMLINNKSNINKCRDTGESPLYIACHEGHTGVVKVLINNKADINKCRATGESPLYIACSEGHTEVVKMLINNEANIDKCNFEGVTPLYFACQEGHSEVVQLLINKKANIDKCADTGESPLYIACQEGHTEVVQMLLNNNADINNSDCKGRSTLYFACLNGNTEVVQMLINNMVEVNMSDGNQVSPLYIACWKGNTELVQMLINNMVDINKCRNTRESPLYIACQEGHSEVVQLLINEKANINKYRDTGESPLYIACHEGHTEVVQMLIKNNADINKCKNTGESSLHVACLKGYAEVVQMLINKEADINKCNDEKVTALYFACQEGHLEVVNLLINKKADINKSADTGESPLYIACQEGHTEVVHKLINNKADTDTCKKTGESPLYIACKNRHTEVLEMLINNKADIDKCDNKGVSPLYIACWKGYTEVVQILINNKADINMCRNSRKSPMSIACLKGRIEVVQMLINNKADIDKGDFKERSPLYISCWKGNTELVKMLLNNKADINKCRNNGSSPLCIACREGHTEVVQILINNKVGINKCSSTGEYPIFIASSKGHAEIVKLLLKYKANRNLKGKGLTALDIARQKKHTNIVYLLQSWN